MAHGRCHIAAGGADVSQFVGRIGNADLIAFEFKGDERVVKGIGRLGRLKVLEEFLASLVIELGLAFFFFFLFLLFSHFWALLLCAAGRVLPWQVPPRWYARVAPARKWLIRHGRR